MIGRTLAQYEITSHLGSGGMGEVYQATDSRLGRSVAIKFLPEAFAKDAERVARFQREARVLAALNHPNIASIHGLEESAGTHFLVMELVPGETLADRIQKGPVPVEEAVSIARQIAEALDSAHEKGIVHRDLKPANIKITPEGLVKVLDFGLAKAYEAESSDRNLSNSPTISGTATQHGVILGTAAYMSPEQARGKSVDRRADIWAFGVVLYELVSGKRLFEGETVSDTLAAVLEREVKIDAAPAKLQPLLRSCLERDPRKRLRDIGDAWRLLDLTRAESALPAPKRSAWAVPATLSVLLTAALVPAALYFLSAPKDLPLMRFESPAAGEDTPFVSPDGQRIAHTAPLDGKSVIWVRDIGSLEAKPLQGTENAVGVSLFWSPDNQSLGFNVEGKLKKVDVTSGVVKTLYEASSVVPLGGAWNTEGDVLFGSSTSEGRGVMRIPSSGTAATLVTPPLKNTDGYAMFPQFLPDGRHFLYHTIQNPGATATVYAGSIDSRTSTRLMEVPNVGPFGNSPVRFVEPGYLLFSRNRTLYAQPFDTKNLTVSGDPVAIAQNVAQFSASDTGTVVYRFVPEIVTSSGAPVMLWVDRQGKPAGQITTELVPGNVQVSPANLRVLIDTYLQQASDVWVIDPRGVPQAIAKSPAFEAFPIWNAAGTHIFYAANRTGGAGLLGAGLYQKAANGMGMEELLFSSQDMVVPRDLSPDGRLLVFERMKAADVSNSDIWILPMHGVKEARPFLETSSRETQAEISPDGNYIAYADNATGGYEIVVQAFPDPKKGGRLRITASGGTEPRWAKDGGELFYLSPGGKLMAVELKRGASFEPQTPTELFTAPPLFVQAQPFLRRYDVSADGQRFLFAAVNAPSGEPTIIAIINWPRALKKD